MNKLFLENTKLTYSSPVIFIIIGLFYTGAFFYRIWFPSDDATLALLAQNIVSGEIPHLDFDEPYTGGLSYLNAISFYLFGPSLLALRIPFYITGILAFFLLYFIATRFLSSKTSILIVALCWVVSVPVYSVPMPSWYNLFFFIFSLYAVVRYLESKKMIFLFAAGVLGGLSILIKISGVFLIGCMLLYIYYLNLDRKGSIDTQKSLNAYEKGLHVLGYLILIGLFFFALVGKMVSQEFLFFLLPLVIYLFFLGVLLINKSVEFEYRKFLINVLVYSSGVFLVLISFGVLFLSNNAIEEMIRGTFIAPFLRVQTPYNMLPSIIEAFYLIPFLVLVLPKVSRVQKMYILTGVILFCIAGLLFTSQNIFYEMIWFWLRSIPLIISVIVLVQFRRWHEENSQRTQLVILLCFSTYFMSLIQFPNPHGIYWLYVAPLIVLCSFVIARLYVENKKPLYYLGASFVLFFVFIVQNETLGLTGFKHVKYNDWHVFNYKYGKVLLPSESLPNDLNELNLYIEKNSLRNHYFCTPDCAYVYYFTESKNPTRWIFEVLDKNWVEDRESWTNDMINLLSEKNISHIVINLMPSHSSSENQALINRLENEAFVVVEKFGRFLILKR
ncbi:MAG: ArnT family glycosyltransferase [Gammaproteobacteria bacterium]